MKDTRRTEWIQIRVSREEKRRIEKSAADAGFKTQAGGNGRGIAAWVRSLALGELHLPGRVIQDGATCFAPRRGRLT